MKNLNNLLTIITVHNEEMLEKAGGDQGSAEGLIDFYDGKTGVNIWNPFYDNTLRTEVVPTDEYSMSQLQSMVDHLHPVETYNTGGGCMVDVYKLKKQAGRVKSIGVTDDCIVGYADDEPFDRESEEVWVRHLTKTKRGLN